MKIFCKALLGFLLCLPAFAGEILSGRFYTEPQKIYVNQVFELHFELAVTFGSEVEDLRIGGLPQDAGTFWTGKWDSLGQARKEQDGRSVTVYSFNALARCLKPINQTFQPSVICTLVERRSAGLFSQWQSYPKQKQLSPFTLQVQALPANKPETFSGAVGHFSLAGKISAGEVRPGDIITLTLDLKGKGWMDDAKMPAPRPDAKFKTYPVKETLREPLHITTQQVWIPSSTNCNQIGAAQFTFFNPASGNYETVSAGPFPLVFTATPSRATNETVRVISTAEPAAFSAGPSTAVTLEQMNASFRRFRPVIALAAFALLAFFAFFALFGAHTKLGLALAAVLLAGGVAMACLLNSRGKTQGLTITEKTEVRFAPSGQATVLFTLAPGVTVTPLESAAPWTRIDSDGRRGWILAK